MIRPLNACASLLWLLAPAAAQAPNVVFIMTDDQAQWAMGAYGNRDVLTPNMDRIAREGVLFRRAFAVTPVCSPSRATVLTGRYPTELGIPDWITSQQAMQGRGLVERTWIEDLHEHGYRTALFGKWHLGERPEHQPQQLGFDEFTGFLAGNHHLRDPNLLFGTESRTVPGFLTDVLTEAAIEFVAANRDRPFALCLHYRAPHSPYRPVPQSDRAPYFGRELDLPDYPGLDRANLLDKTRAYYVSVSSVDRNVGRVLDALDSFGLAENTLVIFTSDHGYNLGRHGIGTKGNGHWMVPGKRGARPNMWDTSLAIPFAVRWPAVIGAGREIDGVVTLLDVYRTVSGCVGLSPPEGPRGLDWSPALRGEPMAGRRTMFGMYDLRNGQRASLRMVRTERHKLVVVTDRAGADEFYDLAEDPGERDNLLPERADGATVERLRAMLREWRRSIGDL